MRLLSHKRPELVLASSSPAEMASLALVASPLAPVKSSAAPAPPDELLGISPSLLVEGLDRRPPKEKTMFLAIRMALPIVASSLLLGFGTVLAAHDDDD